MELTTEQQSVFDGLMLSDAFLECRSANARFSLTSKHRSFIDATIKALPFSWASATERDIYDRRTLKTYHSCCVRSHTNEWLTQQHLRWYKNRIKIVPNNLSLTPLCVLWWYLGDGHLARKRSRPNYRRVIMATDSFSDSEKEWLKDHLQQLVGENVYVEQSRTIVVAGKSLVRLASLIGTHSPVADYQYKFDFGNYLNDDYLSKSYETRPLAAINKYRRIHKVRELDYQEVKQEML